MGLSNDAMAVVKAMEDLKKATERVAKALERANDIQVDIAKHNREKDSPPS